MLLPLLLPEVLGGFVDGLVVLESGVVLGGFEAGLPVVLLPEFDDAPELLCPEFPVAELLLLLLPELSGVAELLPELLPVVAPELLVLPLCPDWSGELWPEGDALFVVLDPVWPLCVLMLPLLL